jgi:hypothetical protein
MKKIFLFIASFLFYITSLSQTGRISEKVFALEKKGMFKKKIEIWSEHKRINIDTEDYTILDMKDIIFNEEYIELSIQKTKGEIINLLLYKEQYDASNIVTSSGLQISGNVISYRGIIKRDSESLVSLSTDNKGNIMAVITGKEGNYILGKMENGSEDYILYNSRDMDVPDFSCIALPIPLEIERQYSSQLTVKCIKWYWETDYDLFVNKGSVEAVNTYIQGIFNQVRTLYANDGISIALKTLFIWDTPDPYTGPTTNLYLFQFGQYRTSFDGDLAHLIGLQGNGGVAFVNTLCLGQGENASLQMAYSGIFPTYNNIPTYSWTVYVITHEQGHNLGSLHTHDCVWGPNHDTQIDNCAGRANGTGGTCVISGDDGVGGGTIMSYCHLTPEGINFNKGFGPEPTALLISNINSAPCLETCGTIVPVQLVDFQAKKQGKDVKLSWQTSSEIESSRFEVEVSKESTQFMKIGEISAAGNSYIQKFYYLFDTEPNKSGIRNYRLKMIDVNRTFTYSAIRQVMFEYNNKWTIYPNPALNQLTIQFISKYNMSQKVTIKDQIGREIFTTYLSVNQGLNSYILNISLLSAGMYLIQTPLEVIRFVKY